MPVKIDTPAEVREWKARMLRVANAHHVKVPDGFDPVGVVMGPVARELMHLLASHANGYHGQHVLDDSTLNGSLQAWLVAVDPQKPVPALVYPVPGGQVIGGGIHETMGLAGYPALDFGAPAGSPVVACEAGLVERFSGHDPAGGPVDGIHGPFGWSIYLRGESGADYFYTHLGSRSVSPGQRVTAGQRLGSVGDYARWGGANHCHMGVHPPADGHPSIVDVQHAPSL